MKKKTLKEKLNNELRLGKLIWGDY